MFTWTPIYHENSAIDLKTPSRVSKKHILKNVTQQSDERGAVCAQFRKRGDKVYGPYYARFWRENGKLHKAYVRLADAETAKAACDTRRAKDHERRRERADVNRVISDYAVLVKVVFLPDKYQTAEEVASQLTPRQILRLRAMGMPI